MYIGRVCSSVGASYPIYVKGSFILPSVSQFELGDQKFVGLLDGFGKLQRFEIMNGQICFSTKMMSTLFYNESVQNNKIAPSILFFDTEPSNNYSGMEVMTGPNGECSKNNSFILSLLAPLTFCAILFLDNVYVNPVVMGGEYRMVTDSQVRTIQIRIYQ
jgi:hypothetical protein